MTTYMFNIITLLGGLALFLFGMDVMLQISEGKLEAHEYLNALKAGELHESASSPKKEELSAIGQFLKLPLGRYGAYYTLRRGRKSSKKRSFAEKVVRLCRQRKVRRRLKCRHFVEPT